MPCRCKIHIQSARDNVFAVVRGRRFLGIFPVRSLSHPAAVVGAECFGDRVMGVCVAVRGIYGLISFVLCVQHFVVGDEGDVAHFGGFVGTALCEAGLGEDIEMLIIIAEQITAPDKRLQYSEIDLFVCPFTFRKSLVFLRENFTGYVTGRCKNLPVTAFSSGYAFLCNGCVGFQCRGRVLCFRCLKGVVDYDGVSAGA